MSPRFQPATCTCSFLLSQLPIACLFFIVFNRFLFEPTFPSKEASLVSPPHFTATSGSLCDVTFRLPRSELDPMRSASARWTPRSELEFNAANRLHRLFAAPFTILGLSRNGGFLRDSNTGQSVGSVHKAASIPLRHGGRGLWGRLDALHGTRALSVAEPQWRACGEAWMNAFCAYTLSGKSLVSIPLLSCLASY